MMTDNERRKVFWLVKKYSSYTAWKALADAYCVFSDAYMKAIRIADHSKDDELDEATYSGEAKRILDGRIAFEKGLPRLKKGDRSVWRRNSRGILGQGLDQITFIRRIMDPEEYMFDWMKNKDEVVAAHEALRAALASPGAVTERPEVTDEAPLATWDVLTPVHPTQGWPMNNPAHLNFPPSLPEVPAPAAFVVETGSEVPYDGIYEPEWGEVVRGNNGLLARIASAVTGKSKAEPPRLIGNDEDADSFPPSPRREHIGCMNYLLGGTSAPYYSDEENTPPMPVAWRLIWKDTRYLDGSIPEEEAEYLKPITPAKNPRQRCPAGQPCPQDGWWFTPAKAGSCRFFRAGETMPRFESDYGETIWQMNEKE
jgi:hypothetical protein